MKRLFGRMLRAIGHKVFALSERVDPTDHERQRAEGWWGYDEA